MAQKRQLSIALRLFNAIVARCASVIVLLSSKGVVAGAASNQGQRAATTPFLPCCGVAQGGHHAQAT